MVLIGFVDSYHVYSSQKLYLSLNRMVIRKSVSSIPASLTSTILLLTTQCFENPKINDKEC